MPLKKQERAIVTAFDASARYINKIGAGKGSKIAYTKDEAFSHFISRLKTSEKASPSYGQEKTSSKNIISEECEKSNTEIKMSVKDEDYLSAVKSGDMQERSFPTLNGSSANEGGAHTRKASSTDIIRNKSEKSNTEIKMSVKDDDISAVQSIGRKSVNEYTSEDIAKTEAFARRYWQEMGTKSPFFRAWFGDWHSNDQTPVEIANVQGDARGVQLNEDTGWNVQVSGKAYNETQVHTGPQNKAAVEYLSHINDIVRKAILLDSYAMGKTKSANSLLMHSLYAVADIGNGPELIKLYVEEMNNPNSPDTTKRAYQLQYIECWQSSAKGSGNALAQSLSTANIKSVADLFAAVKRTDANFNPKPASAVVNEDGTPMLVYHGTDESFNVFDSSGSRANMDIQGNFFSPWEDDARGYGMLFIL